MKNHFCLCLMLWLCSSFVLQAQQRPPEFIKVDQTEKAATSTSLFQKYYKLRSTDKLDLKQTETDSLGVRHEKFQQYYKGVKVDNAIITAHSRGGVVTLLSGNYGVIPALNVVPAVSAERALSAATAHVGAKKYMWEETLPEGVTYEKPAGELVVVTYPDARTAPKLAWKFDIYAVDTLYRAYVYVDAQTGRYIKEELILRDANVNATGTSVYNGTVNITAETFGSGNRLRETSPGGRNAWTRSMNNRNDFNNVTDITSGSSSFTGDNAGVQAHFGAEQTYNYYWQVLGRNSYDNNAAEILSFVHFRTNLVNAFWDGSQMKYGDGDGISTDVIATLDICGHELTHAVTQFTANLVYQGESGALNESFSDIFGEAIEGFASGGVHDWLMGDQIGLPGHTGRAFRSMSNPSSKSTWFGGAMPDTYLAAPNWYTGPEDFGGVHHNSSVQNFWFYLLSQGGSGTNDLGNNYCVTGIGINSAARIAYRNLTVYLSANSNYNSARAGAILAAQDLFGVGSPEEVATTNAWYAVGVGAAYAPNLSCPANITVNNSPGQCAATVNYSAPVAHAACPTVTISGGLPSGSVFPVGTTTNTYHLSDGQGGTANCAFTVKVIDASNPTISCPPSKSVNTDPNQCSAVVNYPTPVGTDNCPVANTIRTGGLASGSAFPKGTTVNIFKVTDGAGLTATCQFSIKVTDNQNPAIACPADKSVNTDPNQCSAVVSYTAPVGTDNCPGQTTARTGGLASGAVFPKGATVVTYTVTDAAGLNSNCHFTVTVSDHQAPAIACPSNKAVFNDPGVCTAVVQFTASATDNCPAPVVITYSQNPGTPFPVGTTTVTATATDDSNNASNCAFTVKVTDNEVPVVTCPANLTQSCEIPVTPAVTGTPTATDNCGLGPQNFVDAKVNGNCPGNYILNRTWTVFDNHNNSSTCKQVITVQDLTAPVLKCPANITVVCDIDPTTGTGKATITDNCDPAPLLSYTDRTLSGDCAWFCLIDRTWSGIDHCANASICVQKITKDPLPKIEQALNADVTGDGVPDLLVLGFDKSTLTVGPGRGNCVQQWLPSPGITPKGLAFKNAITGADCLPGTNPLTADGHLSNPLLAEALKLNIMVRLDPALGTKKLSTFNCAFAPIVLMNLKPNPDVNELLRVTNLALGNIAMAPHLTQLLDALRCINLPLDVCK